MQQKWSKFHQCVQQASEKWSRIGTRPLSENINNKEDVNLETQCVYSRYFWILTRVNILIFIKHFLKTLLNLECTDGAQAVESGREVGENRTPSFKKSHRQYYHFTYNCPNIDQELIRKSCMDQFFGKIKYFVHTDKASL